MKKDVTPKSNDPKNESLDKPKSMVEGKNKEVEQKTTYTDKWNISFIKDVFYLLGVIFGGVWAFANYIIENNKFDYVVSKANFFGIALNTDYMEKGYYLVPRIIFCVYIIMILIMPLIYRRFLKADDKFIVHLLVSISSSAVIAGFFYDGISQDLIPRYLSDFISSISSKIGMSDESVVSTIIVFLLFLVVYNLRYVLQKLNEKFHNLLTLVVNLLINFGIALFFIYFAFVSSSNIINFGKKINANDEKWYEVIQGEEYNIVVDYQDGLAVVVKGNFDEEGGTLTIDNTSYKKVKIEDKVLKSMYFNIIK